MQVKQTQVIRLANVMGMDIDNKQHQIALHDSITQVSEPDDFIEYCRNRKDSIDYANRLDKLEALFTRYKKTIDNIPVLVLEEFSKTTSDKFRVAIQILRDNESYLTDRLEKLKDDGVQYFTNKEIELLNATGSLFRLINLYELGTLYDALYETSVRKTIAKQNNKELTEGQKRVKALIGVPI